MRGIGNGITCDNELGPLLFLIYVNDLPEAVTKCTVNLYADDTTIYCSDRDPAELKSKLHSPMIWRGLLLGLRLMVSD